MLELRRRRGDDHAGLPLRRGLPVLLLPFLGLAGCDFIASLLSTDTVIDASCAGDDTVVVDGRDLCDEYEKFGKIDCDVGYRVILDGNVVCD